MASHRGKWRARYDYLRWLNWEAGYAVRDAIVRKLKKIFKDPLWAAGLLIRMSLVVLLALSIGLWVDPYLNLIPYPLNAIVFGFLLMIYAYFHLVLNLPTAHQK